MIHTLSKISSDKISPHENAPGAPGSPPRWTSSAKTGVGTAIGNKSQVWFTLSHGILNEVFYPRIDQACIRDMGLMVTDGAEFFSEERTDTNSEIHWLAKGVPAFRLVNTCRSARYRIEKQVLTDPRRNTLMQRVHFVATKGDISDYRLHVLVAPHLGNHGDGNTAWVDECEGLPILFAQRDGSALALACSAPFLKRSAGYVGSSDGWQDLKKHKQMTWEYTLAQNGNVALTAEIDLLYSKGQCELALSFGTNAQEAAQNAVASLREGFDNIKHEYITGWQHWKKSLVSPKKEHLPPGDLSPISLAVLRTHESKTAPGGLIASLAIPWGASKGDGDQGGYHLVWARDMVETAGALLASGAHEDVRRALTFLQSTQLPDGHWSQNMWVDGTPYWNGIQLDETALPILLVELALREKALTEADVVKFWPMVQLAAGYVVRNGPVSPQDRWEEDPGYSPFSVAAEIAAILAAANMADLNHESSMGTYLREIADVWHTSIDRWMYAAGTDWCRRFAVQGYYLRIASDETAKGSRFENFVHVKNVAAAEDNRMARHLVSPDALALVRFGLRAADDPRILGTVKVIDSLLKVETPTGPSWHRYNDDGYGEHEDGAPFDGTGIGRAWPLLTGERAHYELLARRVESAKGLLATMESFANEGGLISEQIWDSPDLPKHHLFLGKPSGSAMPLVWAHAEYIKLRRSLRDGHVFDLPPQTVQRYLVDKTESPRLVWRFNHKIRSMPAGKSLRIETLAPAVIHYSFDDWKTTIDAKSRDVGLGVHVADLDTQSLPDGREIKFTFHWPGSNHWEGRDFLVRIAAWRRDGTVLAGKSAANGN
jgi:glucoamylase